MCGVLPGPPAPGTVDWKQLAPWPVLFSLEPGWSVVGVSARLYGMPTPLRLSQTRLGGMLYFARSRPERSVGPKYALPRLVSMRERNIAAVSVPLGPIWRRYLPSSPACAAAPVSGAPSTRPPAPL